MLIPTLLFVLGQKSAVDLGWKPVAPAKLDYPGDLAYRRGPLHATFRTKLCEDIAAAENANREAGMTQAHQFPLYSGEIEKLGLRLYEFRESIQDRNGNLVPKPLRQYLARGTVGRTFYELRCKNLEPVKPAEMKLQFEKFVVSFVKRSPAFVRP